MDKLTIGGRDFTSRLFVGTGKFSSNQLMLDSILASESEMITVAMKRIDMEHEEDDDMLQHINRERVQFLPNTSGVRNAEEAVMALHKKYRLFLASNGTAVVQHGRMPSADLYRYFEKVFVSQEIGYNKPAKAYFEACFAAIPGFDVSKALMVGDSLSSDIRGGINAGLKTVWVNPGHAAGGDIKPDYEIAYLYQLEALLETME